MMKAIIGSLLLLFAGLSLSAQDPVFSQFYAAPMRLNPAFAGISTAPRVTMNYRAQYVTWPNAFTTYTVGYEQPIANSPSSFGLTATADLQADGAYSNYYFSGVYSYEVQMGEFLRARLGISAGVLQTAIDFDRFIFGDVVDPIDGAGNPSETMERLQSDAKTDFDAGVGLLVYANGLYGGVSLDHLNRPNESLFEINENLYAGRPMRMSFHAGGQINLKRYSNRSRPAYVTPNILYTRQAAFQQLMLGAYFGYGPMFIGGWYREGFENSDALIGVVGVRKGVLRIGYSFDLTVSELSGVPGGLGGVHEISLAFDFGESADLQRRRHRSRFNDCFGMFR
ncbi:MAG: type IX secretion system membrane protein PorP/SprF [Bacteroidota bacterium]